MIAVSPIKNQELVMLKITVFVLTIAIAAATALGQAPTLRIVQSDGPNLPADLFYGNIRVKPLRLRPGTNQVITIDDADFFVNEQYVDFLGRFPDQGGFDYWTAQITSCGSNAACIYSRRVGVSAAFFVEAEFQRTGSFVYRTFKGGLGRLPDYAEFGPDRRTVIEGPNLEQTKQAYALNFVQRAEFMTKYAGQQDGPSFVNALVATIQQTSGVSLNAATQASMLSQYNTGSDMNSSRARALRVAIDDGAFGQAEYNRAFVLMQYFGYLRRNPNDAPDANFSGFTFWLNKLNSFDGDFRKAEMVKAFITSSEYRQRFGTN
jgi:hypothetical protein